jgi:hypothetical protein
MKIQITPTHVYVPFERRPRGIWLDDAETEHPSFEDIARLLYPGGYDMFDEDTGDVVAYMAKVPRRSV